MCVFGCFAILSDVLGHITIFPNLHVLSHHASNFNDLHSQIMHRDKNWPYSLCT